MSYEIIDLKSLNLEINRMMDILNNNPITPEVHYTAFQSVDVSLRLIFKMLKDLHENGKLA